MHKTRHRLVCSPAACCACMSCPVTTAGHCATIRPLSANKSAGSYCRHRLAKQPDIIAVPKPVDVLQATVERAPLRVIVFQEIEPRETTVRTGIMVALVDRMRRDSDGHRPQSRE